MPENELGSLGWDEAFQTQLDELGLEGVLVGRVSRVETGLYWILSEEGESQAKVPGRMKDSGDVPCVGDWVLVKPLDTGDMIFKILDRKNKVSRKVAGQGSREQLIAANIDVMFLVMGLDGDYNLRRMERFIFMVAAACSRPVIILNKMDIAKHLEDKLAGVEGIAGDIPVHTISALNNEGLEAVREYLGEGVTIALVGSSGVGKSTLINSLIGEEKLKTGAVREKDSHGRHVTTSRELYVVPTGGLIIDNPGIRELQLWGDASDLEAAFKDIEELGQHCRFKDCQHESEPKCAVKAAVEAGEIPEARYQNYLKMKKELAYLQRKTDMSAEAAERAKWKGILKGAEKYIKYKKGK